MLFFRPVTPEYENTDHGIMKYSQFSFKIAKKMFLYTVNHILFSDSCWNLLGLTPSTTFSGGKRKETLRHFTDFTGGCANATKQQRLLGERQREGKEGYT